MEKSGDNKEKEKVSSVLELLRNQAPLSVKQEKFCDSACVQRFLKAKGGSVKKASRQLRACLSWRESIGTENLMADEFSAELADGVAYVAGHDEESRPVMIFRIKQDYRKFHSQKLFIRLLVFTLEVAIGTMHGGVEKFVLLFDASFYRSASSFMNLLLATLKIVAEYYPGRLHKAFVIDPPSLFSYLWKGVRPFLELSPATMVVSLVDFDDSTEFTDYCVHSRTSSLRFDSKSSKSTTKIGSCSSSRFAFTVSHHFDSLKPWYLSFADSSASKVGPAAQIAPLNARSLSFASPAAGRGTRGSLDGGDSGGSARKGHFFSTPAPEKPSRLATVVEPRTPQPAFLRPQASLFSRGECHVSGRSRESFVPFLKFYRRPYDEITYRSMMRAPLGGLISIVHPQQTRRHASLSRRF